jgi:hypothetical protein
MDFPQISHTVLYEIIIDYAITSTGQYGFWDSKEVLTVEFMQQGKIISEL